MMGDVDKNLMKLEDNTMCFGYSSNMTSFGYCQTFLRPTRVQGCFANTIDQIWVNILAKPMCSGINLSEPTDHFPITSSTVVK